MRLFRVLYFVLIAVLAISTFCSSAVYSSWWFASLWSMTAANLAWLLYKSSLWRRPGLMVLHLSFLVILAGGLATKLTAREGTLILSRGIPANNYISRGEPVALPFEVQLDTFEIVKYPGGDIARDYVSRLSIDGKHVEVAVNKPHTVEGIRLFQASFLDEHTSVIGVRSDRYGRTISFVGYALFLIGGVICMFRRKVLVIMLLCVAGGVNAAVPVLKPEISDSLARQSVVYNGRVTTMSTVCHDVMLKVTGKRTYRGLSAERTLLSLMAYPREWSEQPIIKGEISLANCFDAAGNYVMGGDVATDERVGVLVMLYNGSLFQRADEPLAPARVEAELIYNRLPWTLVLFVALFVCGAASFFWPRISRAACWAVFALQVAIIGVEWWLTGHGPFASMFETLQLLVVVTLIISLNMQGMTMSMGIIAAGCMALVSHLQAANPMVTPLMPVLHSPWLSMHVTLVMTAYSLLVLSSLTALIGLLCPAKAETMRRQAVKLLRPGVFLLGLGIFSGAVWADVSWGRYWGWDPKETWALVTFMLYAVPLHSPKPSLWWIFAPIASIAMTYFGVNYLPSLHAYAG